MDAEVADGVAKHRDQPSRRPDGARAVARWEPRATSGGAGRGWSTSARSPQHVRQVVLAPERMDAPAPPGSHIDIGVYVNGRADVRSYSVVGSGAYGDEIILGVQLARQSRGGSAFIHQLRRGQEVQITQPLQNFPLNYGRPGYVLAAGGIGITALVAMGKALKARGADYRFVYGARSRGLMAFVDDLVAEHGDRMDLRIDDEGGSLDVDELVASVPAGGELYVCGPAPMLDAIKAAWARAGRRPSELRFETFGSPAAGSPRRRSGCGSRGWGWRRPCPATCPCSRRWRPAART